jgi:uncharacterized protein
MEGNGFITPNTVPFENTEQTELGVITSGSLSSGLQMRLHEDVSIESVRVGKFVTIGGEQFRFFSLINDVILDASHPGVLMNIPDKTDLLARAVIKGTNTFGTVKLRPMLMVENGAAEDDEDALRPVKSIPAHFSEVFEADSADVARVFGSEERNPKFFHIGEPLDMDTPVCLNLDRWIERSNAIFGKSGTGKTFLTRLALCGVIKANKAVNLIFDMHSEYGFQGTTEERGRDGVRGLKSYFGSRVQIFTLDRAATSRRQVTPDYEVKIPYSAVTIDDILLLERELGLTSTAVETSYLLASHFGEERWLEELLKMDAEDIKDFVEQKNAHSGSLSALQRKLRRLTEECKQFLKPDSEITDDAVKRILGTLESGTNVVLEFGQYDRVTQYMLVANILTRRLHQIYREKSEAAMGNEAAKPKPLVIAIEEAHKFLAPHLADQTIFGTIAREMRKYNVTLLIVDQRPSGIDNEVLSQVGTKICCLLDDEKDIDSVLTGVSGANSLRTVLASLETKQQALIFGHAVPMPVVVKTRTYDDEAFRLAMGRGEYQAVVGTDADAVAQRRERVKLNISRDF